MLDFPVNKVEYALFKGIEQEGPFKGVKTLFVVGDCPLDKISNALKSDFFAQIYLGAGGRFDYNKETVRQLLQKSVVVTIENPVVNYECLVYGAHWMLPILWKNQPVSDGLTSLTSVLAEGNFIESVSLKLDTGSKTFVVRLQDFIRSDYSDYGGDELILQKLK